MGSIPIPGTKEKGWMAKECEALCTERILEKISLYLVPLLCIVCLTTSRSDDLLSLASVIMVVGATVTVYNMSHGRCHPSLTILSVLLHMLPFVCAVRHSTIAWNRLLWVGGTLFPVVALYAWRQRWPYPINPLTTITLCATVALATSVVAGGGRTR